MTLDGKYLEEASQRTFAERARTLYGADQIADCIAVLELDGNLYLLCASVLEYSGKWHIAQFGGNLSQFLNLMPAWMGLVPLSIEGADEWGVDVEMIRTLMAGLQ